MGILTKHSKKRAKQRLGLNDKSLERMAPIVLENGFGHSDLPGKMRKYVDGLYLSHGNGNNIKIYGNHIYIFMNEVLITILHLPNRYKKIIQKIKSRKWNADRQN